MLPGKDFKRGTVESYGYVVPYAEAGEGEVVVFLPGSAGLEMSTAKDMLSAEYRVIELDPPGWGETPQVTARMKQRQLAVILADALIELGVETCHLVGTSMGCTNAMWIAEQFPDRVQSLVLEGPMLFYRSEDLANPDEGPIIALRNGAPPPDVSAYPAPPAHPNKPWATADFFREQMKKRFKMFRWTDHPADNRAIERFANATVIPITLALGTQDEILKPCYADRFAEVVPSARITMIEGGTHDLQNTAPLAFVNVVKDAIAAAD
ncbi:alpha/beta hydrolase [Sphingobium sp. MK2]|uniref:alpha/beta fold hydrolase n=1 Tax=Sphingobium sp. MK2 TaxID=3116540 RepID=UPI0032E35A65